MTSRMRCWYAVIVRFQMPLSQRNCVRSWHDTLPGLYACDAYVQLGVVAQPIGIGPNERLEAGVAAGKIGF